MKIKGKLNVGGLKNALVVHGEKFAFGLAGFCFLIFVYAALTRETLGVNRQPAQLLTEAGTAEAKIIDAPPGPAPEPTDFLKRTKEPVVIPKVRTVLLNSPVVEPKVKRSEPELFPVEELRAVAGVGTFAIKPAKKKGDASPKPGARAAAQAAPAGKPAAAPADKVQPWPADFKFVGFRPALDTPLKSYYYTLVTGVVPLRKQALHYEATFRNAEGSSEGDRLPNYVDFRIERMELPEGAWAEIDVPAAKSIEKTWAENMLDVIPPDIRGSNKFVPKDYLAPLPSIVGAEWDDRAAHPPRIKFVLPGKSGVAEERDATSTPSPDAGGAIDPTTGERMAVTVDDRLFRFFDFDVAPEKQYRYRVKLVLKNPNFELPPDFLQNAKSAQGKTVEAPYCPPTAPVTVPLGGSMYVGPVVPGKGQTDTAAKVLVSVTDQKSALEATVEIDAPRGMLLNKPAAAARAIDPRGVIRTLDSVTFQTNCILLDLQGGGPIDKEKEKEGEAMPGEVLIASLDDSLSVASEIDDSRQFKLKQVPSSAEESGKAGPVRAGIVTPFAGDPVFGPEPKSKNGKTGTGTARPRRAR